MNFEEKTVERIKKLEREVERLRVKESPGVWQDWTATKSAQWTETGTVTWTTRYTKIGKIVTVSVWCSAVGGSIALSSLGYITLPFAVSTTGSGTGVVVTGMGVQLGVAMAYQNSSNLYFSTFSAMSNEFFLTLTYEAA